MISGLEKFPEMIAGLEPVVTRLFNAFNELWPSVSAFGGAFLDLLKPLGGVLMSDGMVKFAKGIFELATTIEEVLLPPMKLLAIAIQFIVDKILPKGKEPAAVPQFAYLWNGGGMDSMLAAGYQVDKSRQKQIQDSVSGKYMIGDVHFFNRAAQVDSFNRVQSQAGKGIAQQIQSLTGSLMMPYMKVAGTGGAGKAGSGLVDEASESIVGGGRKQIIIHVNAPMYKVDHQVFEHSDGGVKDFEEKVTIATLKILQSANAAM